VRCLTKDNNLSDVKCSNLITGEEVVMLTITIVTVLGGAVLGLRHKVFILMPAATFVLVFVIGLGVARGASIWEIALEMLVATTALQLGYAGGSAFTAARAAASRRRRTLEADAPRASTQSTRPRTAG
jgi:hypothetical protein